MFTPDSHGDPHVRLNVVLLPLLPFSLMAAGAFLIHRTYERTTPHPALQDSQQHMPVTQIAPATLVIPDLVTRLHP